jgi:signal transduction histidine kinase/ActR/RegA family two-component response regulator
MRVLFHWLRPANFMPHGHCYLWRPDVLWLHVGSDTLIALSYYAIPVALAYFVRRRRAVLPYWWVPALFAMFIFLCGTTHVMNIWTVWNPDYVADGLVKLATGLTSAATAVLVFAVLPQALALRTPIELQREVDGQTAELLAVNARLRLALEQLAEADQRKNQFLATLAHELRNPLAPISNGVQVMQMSAKTEPTLKPVTLMMERQMKHLVRLVDDLLDISRITRGKVSLRTERLSLEPLLKGAIEMSWTPAETERLELRVEMAEAPIDVEGDRDRLTQVFSNILSNAAKYTAGSGKVWLSLRREGSQAVVRIQDTGVGIPPEALEHVFEMFSQLSPAGLAESGLGIGLALVRELVELHGGQVEARSDGHNRGSEFVVRLPALEPNAATDGSPAQPPRTATTIRRRVLVVDDNLDAAEALKQVLLLLGHEVHQTADGATAIDVVRHFEPDVVFMDIGMPGMNGLEAARRIRRLTLARQPLICALTGWGQDADRESSQAAGIDRHLVKPVDRDTLQSVLEQLQPAAS